MVDEVPAAPRISRLAKRRRARPDQTVTPAPNTTTDSVLAASSSIKEGGPNNKIAKIQPLNAFLRRHALSNFSMESNTELTNLSVMDLRNSTARDVSPSMPRLTPEVPSFENLAIEDEEPPVLSLYGEDDQASDKSGGDSGKENEEDATYAPRGTRTNRLHNQKYGTQSKLGKTSLKPKTANNAAYVNVEKLKKPVLGEANTLGRVTRSSNHETTSADASSSERLTAISPLEISKQAPAEKDALTNKAAEEDNQSQTKKISKKQPKKPEAPVQKSRPEKGEKGRTSKSVTATRKPSNLGATKKSQTTKPNQNNRQITEFFPIRRSVRKTASELAEEQARLIRSMLSATKDDHLDLEVQEIAGKGRGIVTTRKYTKGEFVLEYAGELILNGDANSREKMYAKDEKGCYMYYFNFNQKNYCIDATEETGRYGRLVNHSRTSPNLTPKVFDLNCSPRLVMYALYDIEAGTEIVYDYGDRDKESLKAHPWLSL